MMAQGILPFKYEFSSDKSGMTALAGLPVFFELAWVLGLVESMEKHVHVRANTQGWTDAEMLTALVLLNLSGGEHVEDLDRLEADEGLSQVMLAARGSRLGRSGRRELNRRWRKGRERAFPSRSAMHRYLREFHSEDQEHARGEALALGKKAFIPEPTQPLLGIVDVVKAQLAAHQKRNPVEMATLDQDATLVFCNKAEAKHSYKGQKAYQPLNTWWAEQQLMVHTELRDGNVPAGHEQLRVLQEALACLPEGVTHVRLRSDTAGYQHDLLQYCAEGKNERFGVIPFAICSDVTPEFKKTVAKVPDRNWTRLYRTDPDGTRWETHQEWAEVCFVPTEVGRKKHGPAYRYLAIREPMSNPELPGLERKEPELPFPTIHMHRRRYKLFGIVTNMQWDAEPLIWWQRERCGKSEEVHAVLKSDLAGGVLPSGYFGANAAWWWMAVISLNLLTAMKQLVLGEDWIPRRLKAIRFHLIHVPGRIVNHARGLAIRLSRAAADLLLPIRQRINALLPEPAP